MFGLILRNVPVFLLLFLSLGPGQTLVTSADSYAAMTAAVDTNDAARLEALLKQGADANSRDQRGLTILMRTTI
jgi:ankyrin repeat protein